MLRFDCRFGYASGFALDFAFTAPRGVTALVGPSGSGKTTVLNLIAGLLTPSEGVIALGDETLFDAHGGVNLPPERRMIGYVFQDYQLFPHMTVEGNLRYGQRRLRVGPADFDKIVKILELEAVLPRAPATLSGGQMQRVALGRALLRQPRALLLDEPLNALDTALRQSIAEYLERIVAEFQVPCVLVSHDQASVSTMADRVASIHAGNAAGRE